MEDAGEDLAGEGNGDSASATGVESVTTVEGSGERSRCRSVFPFRCGSDIGADAT